MSLIGRDMMMALGAQFEKHAAKSPALLEILQEDLQWGGLNHFIRARNRLGNVLESAQLSSISCLILMVCRDSNLANASIFGCIMQDECTKHIIQLGWPFGPLMGWEFIERISLPRTIPINGNCNGGISGRCITVTCIPPIEIPDISKISIELGRPLAIQFWDIGVHHPVENEEVIARPTLLIQTINRYPEYPVPCPDISWLSYYLQVIRLSTLSLRGYRAVYSRRVMGNLVKRMDYLMKALGALVKWKTSVPDGLALRQKVVDPVWIERQRLSLYLCTIPLGIADLRVQQHPIGIAQAVSEIRRQ
jgi:hypothetical protein